MEKSCKECGHWSDDGKIRACKLPVTEQKDMACLIKMALFQFGILIMNQQLLSENRKEIGKAMQEHNKILKESLSASSPPNIPQRIWEKMFKIIDKQSDELDEGDEWKQEDK